MKCTSRLVSSILSTACLLAIPLASVAAAQTQDGFRGVCTGAVDSLDKDGNVIDSAIYEGGAYPFDSAGEQVFTKDNPFLVAPGDRRKGRSRNGPLQQGIRVAPPVEADSRESDAEVDHGLP